ncbi:uncharacterized protein LOC103394204 isoform X2 [Cynoglossus semilaevis]|uniref:uncharacterized protein LOC103394204 isoform X2 n=1 Tax=Cynoglossus semilaevis TaxID=244447 RepID=UPI0004951208|nr:uncharacterized protein LOC103394204 isoform X2 [Cynoglossus semilaevis]
MSAPTVKCQRRSKGRKVERKYVKIKYFDMQTTKHFMDVSSAWSYPRDDFDRVCKIIWSRAEEVEEKFGRGRHAPEPPQRVDGGHTQSKTSHRVREQQKEKDDLGLNPEIIGTCPYLLGCRHHHVPKPAHVLRPVMGTKEKLNKGKEDRERNVVGTRESLGNNQHPAKTQQLHKKCDKKYKTKHAQTHPAKCCQVTCDAYHRRRENISHEASINWTAEHNCVLDLKMSSSVSQNNFSTTCLKAYSQQSSSATPHATSPLLTLGNLKPNLSIATNQKAML